MPLQSSTMNTSLSRSSFSEVSGFGKDGFDRLLLASLASLHRSPRGPPGFRIRDNKVRLILGGEMLPFPTMPRAVSGSVRRTNKRHAPPAMHKNQKIHCQPSLAASAPPMTGPTGGGGATFGLEGSQLHLQKPRGE